MTSTTMRPGHDALVETDRGWVTLCQPIATVIDAVLPTDRASMAVLLEVLRTSSTRREARTVIQLLRLADDPLADFGTMARNALRSWVHLQHLSRTNGWSHPAEVVDLPRSTALLNLASAVAEGRYVPRGVRVSKYKPLLGRLTAASERELTERRSDVERTRTIRAHAFPNLFAWLDRWLER